MPLEDYEVSELYSVYDSPDRKQSAHLNYLHCVEDYSYIQSNGETYQGTEALKPHTLININDGKNVYYQSGFVDPDKIHWIDNDTLDIDGVKINPSFSVYDYRIHFWK